MLAEICSTGTGSAREAHRGGLVALLRVAEAVWGLAALGLACL